MGGAADCPVTLGTDAPIFEQPPGVFQVLVTPEWIRLEGTVLQSARGEIHSEKLRDGNCRLLTYEPLGFCDPACDSPEICVRGVCVSFPEPIAAGKLAFWLSAGPTFEVQPRNHAYSWSSADFGLAEVGAVAISAPGDVAAGFELRACVFDEPAPADDWNALLAARRPGEDVVLRWSNPVGAARVYLRMTTGIGTHGGISPVEIECEGPDVGSLKLPGAYLDDLYKDGWSCGECGSNQLFRYHADQTGTGGAGVQLRAGSSADFGFIPLQQ